MKFSYIANVRMPTEKAHGIQIVKMCEAFASLGHEVSLFVPRRLNPIKDDPYEYYGVRKNFHIIKVPCIDLVPFGSIGFWIERITFATVLWFMFLFRKTDLVYSRDEVSLWFLSWGKYRLYFEVHQYNPNIFLPRVLKRIKGIVAVNNALKETYKHNNTCVVTNGVDLESFAISSDKTFLRNEIKVSQNIKIVLYTGHLFGWKGADTLAKSATLLGDSYAVVFIGGTDADVARFRDAYGHEKNIYILGRRAHKDIPRYLCSADMLVVPNSGKEDLSRFHTAPIKIFEYMASGVPIIASDLPSIREILSEDTATFFESDNPTSLAEKILNSSHREALARNAKEKVQMFSWGARARKIIEFTQI